MILAMMMMFLMTLIEKTKRYQCRQIESHGILSGSEEYLKDMAMIGQQTYTDIIDFYIHVFNLRDIFMNNALLCYFKKQKKKSDVICTMMIIMIMYIWNRSFDGQIFER